MSENHSDNLNFSVRFQRADLSGKTALVLSTWFLSGLLPAAPGTFGTLAAIPAVAALYLLDVGYRVFAVLLFVGIACWSADRARKLLEEKDPSEIVIDEAAGFVAAMVLLKPTWPAMGLVFVLFRFFDIFKPYPIKQVERLPGGMGIVADDLLAGCYAYATARMIFFLQHLMVP